MRDSGELPNQLRRRVLARGAQARALFDDAAAKLGPHDDATDPNTWRFDWSQPAEGRQMAALSAAAVLEDQQPERFQSICRRMQETRVVGAAIEDPLWFGGFAFDAESAQAPWQQWPAARFFAPRLLWIDDAKGERLIATWLEQSTSQQQPLSRSHSAPLTQPHSVSQSHENAQSQKPGPAPTAKNANYSHDEAATRTLLEGATTAAVPSAHQPPPPTPRQLPTETAEQWKLRVRQAREAICSGDLDKIVLARLRELTLSDGTEGQSLASTQTLVAQLAEARPHCTSFALRFGAKTFLGSTPETLVRRQGPWLRAEALAGSAPRSSDCEQDQRNRQKLSASTKDLCEHAIVIEALVTALRRAGLKPRRSGNPLAVPFPEAFHLRTIITALADPDFHLFEAAAAAHPSPAVCGTPTEPAWERLAREEPWRGWYAGALGWADADGNGHLVVALRAALLENQRAWCFAGAGIVGDSDPDVELAETEIKFSVMQNLLSEKLCAHAA